MHSPETDEKKDKCSILIVSPHCDDACFSLGASIQKMREYKIIIWDIFSIKKYSRLKTDVNEVTNTCIKEEKRFAQETGALVVFEDLPEALLREYKKLSDVFYTDYKKLYKNVAEKKLLEELVRRMDCQMSKFQPDAILLPMGCGAHVDHILAREMGLIWSEREKKLTNIYFYEEIPYICNSIWREQCYEEYFERKMDIIPIEIDISGYLEEKEKLMRIYDSQIKKSDINKCIKVAFQVNKEKPIERIWRMG